jgi:glycosyltransferase involved in cell wall biosynthesis
MVGSSRAAGLADVIEFTGRKSNAEVLEILRRAKVFFHASSREGFPVVMVEAMACGLPVVAYRIPGVVDALQDRVTGVLVTERDTVAHAAACRRLLEEASERERLATSGRKQVVQSLTIQAMTDRVEAVYERAVDPGSVEASSKQKAHQQEHDP